LERFIRDMDHSKEPFFKALFTLSSHEPFEVPMETVFPGNDEVNRFFNAAHYTDKCLGEFIRQAKSKPWWDHTLIVLLADHGHRLPGDSKLYEEVKFSIPMLWLGGALQISDTVISTYGSQIDIPKSILAQVQLNATAFRFGKDIFDPSSEKFGFFVFNDGFGFVNQEFTYIHDNVGDTTVLFSGNINKENANKGKAYQQVLMDDYREK
jgi:phosphoglycerol transferase MdoB-like AlkP superfamily enzyme